MQFLALAICLGVAAAGCATRACSPCPPGTHASHPTQSCSACVATVGGEFSGSDAGDGSAHEVEPLMEGGAEGGDGNADGASDDGASTVGDSAEGGVDAASGSDGATPSCTGAAGFGCVLGNCSNDLGAAAICVAGTWECPNDFIDARTCDGCVGNVPPGCTCSKGTLTCS